MEEKCVELREYVSKNLLPEYLSDVENSRLHWQKCEHCQHSFPGAMEKLDAVIVENLSQIRQTLQGLHEQYRGEAQRVVEESNRRRRELNESVKLDEQDRVLFIPHYHDPQTRDELDEMPAKTHTQLIMGLADAGRAIQGNLQFMNDNWGLDLFHVARYYHGGEYDSQVCAPFIASLPEDVQVFMFEAVLAADLVGPDWEKFPVGYGETIYWMIEHAAPEFLRRYLEKELKSTPLQLSLTTTTAALESRLFAIPDRIQELANRMEDIGDSLKAGQMEEIRFHERHSKRAADFEPRLVEALGDKLYSRLEDSTQRDLQLAEYYFSNNPEPDDYCPSMIRFYRAFEIEFRQRVLKPLIQSLVDKGYVNYPSRGSEEPILKNKAYNPMAKIGQVLGLLDKDGVVREIVSGLGLHVDEIRSRSRELKRMRNLAVHGEFYRREDAARVRNMVVGENSILRFLFPAV